MMFLLIVTVTSMLLAAIMSAIAWRIAGDERRRSEARVAALSAEIHQGFGPADDVQLQQNPACNTLFAAPPSRNGSRPFVRLASGGLVLGGAIALAIVAGGGLNRASRVARPAAAATPAAVPPARPLELVALGHERIGDRLTVRGVIRNPSAAGMDRLTAVVFLFTPDGGFLESGRAAVDTAALPPGGESTFAVTVPRAAGVARYRVSFRTDDRVVPHLDRRHES